MKRCQKCSLITGDESFHCPTDADPLVKDDIATSLQKALGDKYTLNRLIGRGAMGAVYRARHRDLDDVAIKVMLGPKDNQQLSERFLREARALRKLRHQHAVTIYDLDRSMPGLTYMVMEMIEGGSLREDLRQRGRINLEETIEIAEAVCSALQAAHERGIIHRDLKPDNILIAEELTLSGKTLRTIKIADFGIVKIRGNQQGGDASLKLTQHGMPIGTPFYMSPEQWFGEGVGIHALDGRADIYALGCTLYELLSGRTPFVGRTTTELRKRHLETEPAPLHEIAPEIPVEVSRVIQKALEKDRDHRQQTATEFAAELRYAYEKSLSRSPLKMSESQMADTAEPVNGFSAPVDTMQAVLMEDMKKEKERQEAEAARIAEENRLAEESRRRAEEKARLMEDRRRKEEEARRKEEERLAEEQRKAEEQRRAEEEARRMEEERLAEEQRKAEEQRREEERRLREEEQKQAEERSRKAALQLDQERLHIEEEIKGMRASADARLASESERLPVPILELGDVPTAEQGDPLSLDFSRGEPHADFPVTPSKDVASEASLEAEKTFRDTDAPGSADVSSQGAEGYGVLLSDKPESEGVDEEPFDPEATLVSKPRPHQPKPDKLPEYPSPSLPAGAQASSLANVSSRSSQRAFPVGLVAIIVGLVITLTGLFSAAGYFAYRYFVRSGTTPAQPAVTAAEPSPVTKMPKGTLVIQTRDASEIFVDDEKIGSTDAAGEFRADLVAGTRNVRVMSGELRPWIRDQRVRVGATTRVSVRHQRAVDVSRTSADARPDQIRRALGRREYLTAEAHYRETLKQDGNDASALAGLGDVLRRQGRYSEALVEYEKAVKIQPRNIEWMLSLGELYEIKQRDNEAEATYRRAVELQPKNAGARNLLAWVLHRTGKLDEALREIDEGLKIREEPDLLDTKAHILLLRNSNDEALQTAQRAVEKGRNELGFRATIAVIKHRMGNGDEAVSDYRRVRRSDRSGEWSDLKRLEMMRAYSRPVLETLAALITATD